MDPTQTYSNTLKALGDALVALTSPDFDFLIQTASQAAKKPEDAQRIRTGASRLIIQVEGARLQLGNALLSAISDQLKENEAGLTAGVAAVNGAIASMKTVASVMGTVTDLLGVVGKIITLV